MKLIKGSGNVLDGEFGGRGGSAFYARVFHELPLPAVILEFTDGARIVDANRGALDLLEINPTQLIGRRFTRYFIEQPGTTLPTLARTFELHSADRTVEIVGSADFDNGGIAHSIVLFSEVNNHGNAPIGKGSLVFTDPETGLPNTLAAERYLEVLCSRTSALPEPLVVAVISAEDAPVGNAGRPVSFARRAVASWADRITRLAEPGVFFARYRPNELLLVISGIEDYQGWLASVQSALVENQAKGVVSEFGASLGVYVWEQGDALSPERLLMNAREASANARREGGGRCVYYRPEPDHLLAERLRGENLGAAFRNGTFLFQYQPVVNLETWQPDMVEGLLRWQNDNGRLLRPIDFLGPVESLPVYQELSLWVLELAMATLERWQARQMNLRLCINVAAPHLVEPGFMDSVADLLAAYPEPLRAQLSIDLLQTGRLPDARSLIPALKRLGKLGVTLAIDDFEVGSSVLIGVPGVPVKAIKIAHSYISGLDDDLGCMFVVNRIIEFGKEQGVAVYAKGVENAQQYNLLRAFGCSGGQGYLISHPVSEQDLYGPWQALLVPPLTQEQRFVPETPGGSSFAMTEHRLLLRDMLNKSIASPDGYSLSQEELDRILVSLDQLGNKIGSVGGAKESRIRSIRHALAELCEEDGQTGEQHLQRTERLKVIVRLTSELLNELG